MVVTDKASAPRKKSLPLKVAPKGSQSPSSEVETKGGKSIFLFADGTGNSSAKLFKTNVWRMYEAVDLGLASPGKHVQIAYYDNGVGTSSFRPLRLLGGIFGIGLKSNVLRLYSFLCRNFQPNDRIYVFGFSRGAFTIRLLVGLITSQGIVQPAGNISLSCQVRDAYRAFYADHWPNRAVAAFFAKIFRSIRDRVIHVKRRLMRQHLYGETMRLQTDVEFVGVWDTVAAYGGPFAEFTRGIDDWIWPLTMPNYGLSPKVRKARHALALDDERDAFKPLLWDEFREDTLIEQATVRPGRLKQAWFTGVHSDVGGGYPDESLSYISLLWMMDELSPDPEAPAVDFVDSFVQRAKDLANPFGPIHNSRGGMGAYYRYQPRKIAAMMHPRDTKTLSLRDPEIHRGVPPHGLLKRVCVHESVMARIMAGTDNYAPAALPRHFDIVAGSGPFSKPLLTAENYTTLALAKPHMALRDEHQENAWDLVWRRRLFYFLTVGVTLMLVALPVLQQLDWIEELCSDDRCFTKPMLDVSLFFLPQSIRDMLNPWAEKPLLVIFLLVAIAALVALGQRREQRFRDQVRGIWKDYLARTLPAEAPSSTLRKVRESAPYQRVFYFVKWRLLPAIFGMATVVALAYGAVIVATQTLYAAVEPHDTFCRDRADSDGRGSIERQPFIPADPCTDLKVNVDSKNAYRLTLEIERPWSDGDLDANPARGVVTVPGYQTLFNPLKRVTSANWLQPLTEVRTHQVEGTMRRLSTPVAGPPTEIRIAAFKREPESNVYTTLVCPKRSGHLYLMVNDAAPLLFRDQYANNQGSSNVSVQAVSRANCPKMP